MKRKRNTINAQEAALLERGEEAVERAQKSFSRQPRYKDNGRSELDLFYNSIYEWVDKYAMEELKQEPYNVDSRRRDSWLQDFWRLEPHWEGVVNQCVLVDSARPWTLTGGKKQVRRFANILHEANGGKGWRHFFRQSSLTYRTTDFGSTTELGRAQRSGPLRALYHVDSARCKWTGKPKTPLIYYPANRSKQQPWKQDYFFNVCSLPHNNEQFLDLGYCQTSRAFELVKLLYGVLMHDQEAVGSKMMKGLLLLSGLEESQWANAMEARETQATQLERKYFGGVYVLANSTSDVKGQILGLSQLPENFDREVFISTTMFGYSLISGYDPREFWPVSSGSLGTARETESQHRKAATKGTLEFPHAWQEQFQAQLPETLLFEFEERDTDAEIQQAEMAMVWSEVVTKLYETGQGGAGMFGGFGQDEEEPAPEPIENDSQQDEDSAEDRIIDRDEARSLLVMHGVLPPEWTEREEATIYSDEYPHTHTRERLMETASVQRAVEEWKDKDDIICLRYDPATCRMTERIIDPVNSG